MRALSANRLLPRKGALILSRCLQGGLLFAALAVSAIISRADVPLVISVDPNDESTLAWLRTNDLCDYVDVKPSATEAEIAGLRDAGWQVSLHMMGHPETFDQHYRQRKRQDFTVDEVLQTHLRANGGNAQNVVWQILVEEDSAGVAFPRQLLREKPPTHAAAYELFLRRLRETLAIAKSYPGVRLWGRAGFASSMHPFASVGLEMVLLERTNDDVEDLSTGHAFARGAARQYGCEWGIDFSQWWTAVGRCDLENSAKYFRRNLYLSYYAGANAIGIELVGPLPGETPDTATALSDALLEFGRFRKQFPAGDPIVPVAVLVSRDHGWISPAYWHSQFRAWNYARIPYRVGDRGLDGLFAAAFPGSTYAMQPFPFGALPDAGIPNTFSLSCVSAEFAPREADVFVAPPPIPFGEFGTAEEAGRTLQREGRDSSDFRPMADSRWGDVLDVVTEDVSPETLSRYQLVIAAGRLTVNEELTAKLSKFVERGGVLVWATGVATPEHEQLTKCRILPRLKQGRAWTWGDQAVQSEAFLYTPGVPAKSSDVSVPARTVSGDPLVVEARHGRGRVVTCLLPWLESEHRPLSGVATRLLDKLIDEVRPVKIDGPPVQFSCSKDSESFTVCIANHADVKWTGKVVADAAVASGECLEVRSGRSLEMHRRGASVHVVEEIEPYDVSILRWSPTSPRSVNGEPSPQLVSERAAVGVPVSEHRD
jgi:hypothetical protein